MSDDAIANALGLKPLEEVIEPKKDKKEEIVETPSTAVVEHDDAPVPSMPLTEASEEVIKDIEKAKKNIDDIIDVGKDSLDELLELAKQSQSPRAFEVVSTLMKTLMEANKEYVQMSEKKKYATEDHPSHNTTTNNVTNNNLILSTTDVLKMLKGDSEE